MDRKLFGERMVKVSIKTPKDFFFVINTRINTIKRMIDCPTYHTDKVERGHWNLIVGMEELAELQQEISKALRGKINRAGLIEEIVDVEHTLMVIKDVFDISEEELDKARYIKTKMINDKIEIQKEVRE